MPVSGAGNQQPWKTGINYKYIPKSGSEINKHGSEIVRNYIEKSGSLQNQAINEAYIRDEESGQGVANLDVLRAMQEAKAADGSEYLEAQENVENINKDEMWWPDN